MTCLLFGSVAVRTTHGVHALPHARTELPATGRGESARTDVPLSAHGMDVRLTLKKSITRPLIAFEDADPVVVLGGPDLFSAAKGFRTG